MRWDDTEASSCRYGENASEIWGDWEILWEDSTADYQGSASFVAFKDGTFCFYEWDYGSCSGCDSWEASEFTDEQIENEMRENAVYFQTHSRFLEWVKSLPRFTREDYNLFLFIGLEKRKGKNQ